MAELIFDNHTHSKHSFDGCEEVFDICRSAIEKGVKGIAITDLCELGVYYLDDWHQQLSELKDEIAAAREQFGDRLDISFGVELGEPTHDPELAAKVLNSFDYDFVLCSIHNVRDTKDFYFLSDTQFDRKKMIDLYFAEQLEMAKQNLFDSFAHLTYAYRYLGHSAGTPEPRDYEELLRELFKTLAQNGKALELNTSGRYRTPQLEMMPTLWEFKLFKECGGEFVTLGSDAHKAEFISGGFDEGKELLKAAGFQYQCFFKNRERKCYKL